MAAILDLMQRMQQGNQKSITQLVNQLVNQLGKLSDPRSNASWVPKMSKPDLLTMEEVQSSSGQAVIAWMEQVYFYASRVEGGNRCLPGDLGYQSLDADLEGRVRSYAQSEIQGARGHIPLRGLCKEILSVCTGDPGMKALRKLLTCEQQESGQDVRAFENYICKQQSLLLLTRSRHLPTEVIGAYVGDEYRKLKLIVCSKVSLRNALLPRAANETPAGRGACDLPLSRIRELLCELESEAQAQAKNSSGGSRSGRRWGTRGRTRNGRS
ncbi:hypothetical protein HOP50_02g16630 [Chloropicon primus]|uniref:Uncharacterized protein n=1 Tax=Chloropicon primus TaxID=1764295 RepID=A0A5B8MFD3_9CHLO|nr:hypothetical protein A3770_02p16670 [Chloropicon primus]UPQ98357.1 hypothetical protein HOP50_02g16630 [Chloropicon primus]|mmetsp:Transcript_4202/g.12256  ORF Transcript_4202/g.12256 Transcript_4202/m.12256 type:complete len:269 (-) Transcript_4202:72-878(-)|eukprot:QDZ19149.1 hypothetical protein A3770_02p16670 [Chloropicon primus]